MIRKLGIGLVALLVGIQLVPYGRDHTNPPVTGSPTWDSPETEALARRACFDCHSHETKWPVYASIAPFSWLVQHDVEEGRAAMNFSTWDQGHGEADEAAEALEEAEMPPWFYLPPHPEAQLSPADKAKLIEGLRRSFAEGGGPGGEHGEHGEDEG